MNPVQELETALLAVHMDPTKVLVEKATVSMTSFPLRPPSLMLLLQIQTREALAALAAFSVLSKDDVLYSAPGLENLFNSVAKVLKWWVQK